MSRNSFPVLFVVVLVSLCVISTTTEAVSRFTTPPKANDEKSRLNLNRKPTAGDQAVGGREGEVEEEVVGIRTSSTSASVSKAMEPEPSASATPSQTTSRGKLKRREWKRPEPEARATRPDKDPYTPPQPIRTHPNHPTAEDGDTVDELPHLEPGFEHLTHHLEEDTGEEEDPTEKQMNEPVGHDPHYEHEHEVMDPEKEKELSIEDYDPSIYPSKEAHHEHTRKALDHPLGKPEDLNASSTMLHDHDPHPVTEVIDLEVEVAALQAIWDEEMKTNPEKFKHNSKVGLMDALQNMSDHHHVVLFGYSDENCEGCVEPHDPPTGPNGTAANDDERSYLEVFNAVADQVAQEEAHVKSEHRDYVFWRFNVRNSPKCWKEFKKLHPHHHHTIPFVAVVDAAAVFGNRNYPTIMPHLRHHNFRSDLYHFLNRLQHQKHTPLLSTEKQLMHTIFESHGDGVTIVSFHDMESLRMAHGRAMEWLSRVMREEHYHIHFSMVNRIMYTSADETPDLSWIAKYNPEDCDLVGFVVPEHSQEEFFTECFNFTDVELEDEERSRSDDGSVSDEVDPAVERKRQQKRWHKGRHDQYKPLRRFVDRMKAHRHLGGGRRWHGVKHVAHFGQSHEHPTLRVHNPHEGRECARRVKDGDIISIRINGTCTGHAKLFLDHSEVPIMVAVAVDSRVEAEGLTPIPPQILPHLIGLCPEHQQEIYLPPSHSKGHHGEVYHVDVVRILNEEEEEVVTVSDDGGDDVVTDEHAPGIKTEVPPMDSTSGDL